MLNGPLALAGPPVAWAALALLVLIMFAPRILPMLARIAGQLMQREVRRRLGVPEPAPRTPPRPRVTVEVIPPQEPPSTAKSAPDSQIIEAEIVPPRPRSHAPWIVGIVALALLLVLSWILFHQR